MEEHNRNIRPDNPDTTKRYFGFLLITLGLIIACYVAYSAYMLYTHPQGFVPFQDLVTEAIEASDQTEDGPAKLVIPPTFLSYFIPIALLMIGTSVASILISGGVKLLDINIKKLQSKLKQQISDLRG